MKTKLLTTLMFTLFLVTAKAQVINEPLNDLVACDADSDGFEVFDLSVMDPSVLGAQDPTAFTVSYYVTEAEALGGFNEVQPNSFTNIINPQTIFVRLEEISSGNFATSSFEIFAQPSPDISNPSSLDVCGNGDFFSFDLSLTIDEITNGNPNLEVSFYETQIDAEINANAIPNITDYTNTSNPQTLYVRAVDLDTQCASLTTLTIRVQPNPTPGTPSNIELCDTENEDSIEAFDLTINELVILNTEPGQLSYYESSSDAINAVNPISDPTNYFNIANPQIIYVRVENESTSCFSLVDFEISVNPVPAISLESTYNFCEGETIVIETDFDSLYTYEWYFNGVIISGEEGNTLDVNQAGTYQLQVFNVITSCVSSKTTEIQEVSCDDSDDDGVIDINEDINGNGNLEDDDTDNDTIPNYLDDDDDGDNVDTIIEVNIPAGRSGATHAFVDTDDDTIENYLDDDDDGDGVLTIDEDYNNNGDPTDDDTNTNNIPDYLDFSVALSTQEFLLSNFSLSPNPTSGTLTLTMGDLQDYEVSIFDTQGKKVMQRTIKNSQAVLDVSPLYHGIYFLQVAANNQVVTKKLIVN